MFFPQFSVCKFFSILFLEPGTALVRVSDKETNQRTLLRELKKDVKDLAFAYTRPAVILGAIDGNGTTFVYNITKTDDNNL